MAQPRVAAPLDPGFTPLALVWQAYQQQAANAPGRSRCAIALERAHGLCSRWECDLLPAGTQDEATIAVMDRMVKSFLWIRGGYRIVVSGSRPLFDHLQKAYTPHGSRAFDAGFMARVYEHPFEVVWADHPDQVPPARESASSVGRHLDGCRIGFDAGGSDRKVSAVLDGKAVYSEEVEWLPKVQSDPQYHYDGILAAFEAAAAHLPRVDAIGVSSAGVYIDNRIMVASLFLKVPQADFDRRVKNMYVEIATKFGPVPLVVANDGDVTALAGAMSLEEGNVLGIAMGTSEAGGYVDAQMNIAGWLNELAFVPVDVYPQAERDEWSGDIGCGVKYFSQDAVIKLAPAAGIALDAALTPAEKLKVVQQAMQKGHAGARQIFETIGVYLGYALAHYAQFYAIDHVLMLGRVTSGEGGDIILAKTLQVLQAEFPALAAHAALHLPDEKIRRVGQSIAAASLPQIKQ